MYTYSGSDASLVTFSRKWPALLMHLSRFCYMLSFISGFSIQSSWSSQRLQLLLSCVIGLHSSCQTIFPDNTRGIEGTGPGAVILWVSGRRSLHRAAYLHSNLLLVMSATEQNIVHWRDILKININNNCCVPNLGRYSWSDRPKY